MGFFLGTEGRVRDSRGKQAISVRATESLLYVRVINEDVRGKIQAAIREYSDRTPDHRQETADGLATGITKTTQQSTVKGRKRIRSRQKKSGQEWTLAVQIARLKT